MDFISTRGLAPNVNASEAILKGLADDGGLYVPSHFPYIDFKSLRGATSYPEVAFEVLAPFFVNDELQNDLAEICYEAFNFALPLHPLSEKELVMELFWGPTAAFKDFGARFLAIAMEKLMAKRNRPLTILVATSGDTGGAVAAAFHKRENINVKVLFPKGRVSARQEKQLTCWGDNVETYAVEGSFDDCQRMVKEAFGDSKLVEQYGLSSANSINLGRLLPQMVYPFYASLEVAERFNQESTMIIPSGNIGNSCGTYWAKVVGAPIKNVILALNANKTVVDYLESGVYEKRSSIATLANAMDVGDPSNIERLNHLFGDFETFKKEVSAYSVSDEEIKQTIERVWNEYNYPICPHTATGEFVRNKLKLTDPTVVYATAHPAKFDTIVEPIINKEIPIPDQLAVLLEKESSYNEIEADYHHLFE
ncbi:MAG: threonine synthase [Sphaerochaetaceae bacterium]